MLNKCILMGRLTKDPEIKYSQAADPLVVGRYTLAVNRKFKRDNEPDADFIPCIAFGKSGEFAEKYLKKGALIAIVGRIQVRSWDDSKGQKHWSTEVIVEEQNFAESKSKEANTASPNTHGVSKSNVVPKGFDPFAENNMDFNIEDDEDIPF